MNSTAFRPRGLSRPALFAFSLVLATLALAGGLTSWWLLGPMAKPNSGAESDAGGQLPAIRNELEARLSGLELAAAQLSSGAQDQISLLRQLNAWPDSFLSQSGLRAVAWWPQGRFSAIYLHRDARGWATQPTQSVASAEALDRQPWHHLAPLLATDRCLWSRVERESVEGTLVLSCSRAVQDSRQRVLGVLRLSFAVDALLRSVHEADREQVLILSDAAGSVLAGNAAEIREARNVPELGQKLPALAPYLTQAYLSREKALSSFDSSGRVPNSVLEQMTRGGASASQESARAMVSAASSPPALLAAEARCNGGWCGEVVPLFGAPWRLISLRPEAPPPWASWQEQLPLLSSLGALLLLMILGLTLAGRLLGGPLRQIQQSLARSTTVGGFDERLPAEFGQIAHSLNELLSSNQQLRQQLLDPRRASQRQPETSGLGLDQLPLPALLLNRSGKVLEANEAALGLLGLRAGDSAEDHLLRLHSNGHEITLAAVPLGWHATECELAGLGAGSAVAVSTAPSADGRGRLVLLHPLSLNGPSSVDGSEEVENLPQLHQAVRLALKAVTTPQDWALIIVEPEFPLPGQREEAQTQAFREQLQARVEDRLEDGESLLPWSAGQYILQSPHGINRQRVNSLCQGLQTALIFADGQRVRLRAEAVTFTVRPGMRVEDVDVTLFNELSADRQQEDERESRRSYTPTQLNALVSRGFGAKRFHLITQHGQPPAGASGRKAFRVLPHLEDDEGFWLGHADFLPAVERLGRRAELDAWLVEQVRNALQGLQQPPPEQVLLSLGPQTLIAADNSAIETLARLSREPKLAECRIVICSNPDEIHRSAVDVSRLRAMVHRLGCGFGLERIGLDAKSLAILDQSEPDIAIMHPQLTRAALRSGSFAIGLESVVRAAERLKAETVLTGVDDQAARQLAEKVGASLAFGFVIGKPSPMLFQAVA